jgi:hypothetical protein
MSPFLQAQETRERQKALKEAEEAARTGESAQKKPALADTKGAMHTYIYIFVMHVYICMCREETGSC